MNGTFEKVQGTLMTLFGAGELTVIYIIANSLTGMFPAWSTILWALAALFGLQAAIVLIAGLLFLYTGVTQ